MTRASINTSGQGKADKFLAGLATAIAPTPQIVTPSDCRLTYSIEYLEAIIGRAEALRGTTAKIIDRLFSCPSTYGPQFDQETLPGGEYYNLQAHLEYLSRVLEDISCNLDELGKL